MLLDTDFTAISPIEVMQTRPKTSFHDSKNNISFA